MNDNSTPFTPKEYDEKIKQTIPFYDDFHQSAFDLVDVVYTNANTWLDIGCGTGSLVEKAAEAFKHTEFILADPSEQMLKTAKERLRSFGDGRFRFLHQSSINMNISENSVDIITAILSHHYYDQLSRKAATKNCFRILKFSGIYITFENIMPASETGLQFALKRWTKYKNGCGISPEKLTEHADRLGKNYFPITINEHLELLKKCGFKTVELFWMSFMQAGFYAIK